MRRGEPPPDPDSRFDSNCITPGTREEGRLQGRRGPGRPAWCSWDARIEDGHHGGPGAGSRYLPALRRLPACLLACPAAPPQPSWRGWALTSASSSARRWPRTPPGRSPPSSSAVGRGGGAQALAPVAACWEEATWGVTHWTVLRKRLESLFTAAAWSPSCAAPPSLRSPSLPEHAAVPDHAAVACPPCRARRARRGRAQDHGVHPLAGGRAPQLLPALPAPSSPFLPDPHSLGCRRSSSAWMHADRRGGRACAQPLHAAPCPAPAEAAPRLCTQHTALPVRPGCRPHHAQVQAARARRGCCSTPFGGNPAGVDQG